MKIVIYTQPRLLRATNIFLLRSDKANTDLSAKRREIPFGENIFFTNTHDKGKGKGEVRPRTDHEAHRGVEV
jgi:hypothetical protein